MAAILVDDAGHPLVASGRKIWDALCGDTAPSVIRTLAPDQTGALIDAARTAVEPLTYQVYQNLVQRHLQDVERDDEARQSAFAAQQQLIDRVALDNVRARRQRDLDAVREKWKADVEHNRHVAPVLECLLAVRIEGEHEQPSD